jgi:PII-like signaling protein
VLLARWLPHPFARLFVVVGFLGGYTTFSSFSFEALALWERGERGLSTAYLVGSVVAGFAAVILGTVLGHELTQPSEERGVAERVSSLEYAKAGGFAVIPEDARLLSIHVGASEHYGGKRLYEAIVEKARAMKLAGASVFPVEMSYGGHRQIHDVLSDYTFIELPVLIEIVDAPDQISAFVRALDTMIAPAMVTIEPARVLRYSHTERL